MRNIIYPKSSMRMLAGSLVLACHLHAATTSNLDFPDTSWPGDSITRTAYLATSFTTQASAPSFRLDSVVLLMGNADQAQGGFTLTIRSNSSSSRPSEVIGHLVGEANPDSGRFTYVPQSGITLEANQTYWVVAGVSGESDSLFRWLASDRFDQTGDWSIGNNIGFSGNAGVSWSIMNYPPSLMEVNATAVPEPAGVLWIACGMASVWLWRRRG